MPLKIVLAVPLLARILTPYDRAPEAVGGSEMVGVACKLVAVEIGSEAKMRVADDACVAEVVSAVVVVAAESWGAEGLAAGGAFVCWG